MGTCKKCRWWGGNLPNRDPDDDAVNVRICTCPKVHFGRADIDSEPMVIVDKKTDHVLESDEVSVQDGSGYWAAMFCGPDFGCIHHEPVTVEAVK